MYVLDDTWAGPQCGTDRLEFDSYDDLMDMVEADPELMKRLEDGYAAIYEE